MSTILTDDELNRIIDSMGWSLDAQERGDMHRLIQAVLAKLAKQADRQRVPDGWREALQTARDAMAKENRIIPSAKFTAAISRIDAMLAAAPEAPAQADRQRVPGPTNNYHQLREALISADQAMAESGLLACHAVRIQIRAALGNAAAPEAPAQVSAVDELAAFEKWYETAACIGIEPIWAAWQARAALAQKGGK